MDQQTLDDFFKRASSKPIYKPYLSYMKLARFSLAQNPIITYWSLCYVVETALKNQTKPNDEFRKFLLDIMSCLEKEKKARSGDSKFLNEKEAQIFIESYGNKLLEKAEENEELLDKLDVAYKLYLTAADIFQMYTIFVREDEENAKRVKFCKWKAVECFKKKKEQEENPSNPQDYENFQSGQEEPSETPNFEQSGKSEIFSSLPENTIPYPSESNGSTFPSEIKSVPDIISSPMKPTPSNNSNNTTSSFKVKDDNCQLNQDLAALQLSESDSKRAELLCESALYAIKANDLLTAVETLKQTLELLYKRARK